jgi:hypothetical protein
VALCFPPHQAVQPDNYLQWWSFVKGVNWRLPAGPKTSIKGKENYPSRPLILLIRMSSRRCIAESRICVRTTIALDASSEREGRARSTPAQITSVFGA